MKVSVHSQWHWLWLDGRTRAAAAAPIAALGAEAAMLGAVAPLALVAPLAPVALAILVALAGAGCASAASAPAVHAAPVAAAPPPKDDGKPAQGGQGGHEHAAALEQLKAAGFDWRSDRQNSLRVLLPDAPTWLRVKFWGVKSLVGFRYGKDHHAIVGGFVVHVPDENAPGACGKAFEAWAQPYVDAFEVEIEHDAPQAISWNGKIVDIDSPLARVAGRLSRPGHRDPRPRRARTRQGRTRSLRRRGPPQGPHYQQDGAQGDVLSAALRLCGESPSSERAAS